MIDPEEYEFADFDESLDGEPDVPYTDCCVFCELPLDIVDAYDDLICLECYLQDTIENLK